MNGDRAQLNSGDVLHILQIAVMLICLGIGYERLSANADITKHTQEQVNRMEHYLSSRDSEYWQRTKE